MGIALVGEGHGRTQQERDDRGGAGESPHGDLLK